MRRRRPSVTDVEAIAAALMRQTQLFELLADRVFTLEDQVATIKLLQHVPVDAAGESEPPDWKTRYRQAVDDLLGPTP